MRKIKTIKIDLEGRDKNKTFVIQEMSARQFEEWGFRAMGAVAKSGPIPAGIMNAGMAGVFILGLQPILAAPWELVKPLLDEMFDTCLSIQSFVNGKELLRGAGTEKVRPVGPLTDVDMEEVLTRLFLRDQIFELHVGFSVAVIASKMWAGIMATGSFLLAQTSQAQSPQSSQDAPSL
jgi:hypothetical protein